MTCWQVEPSDLATKDRQSQNYIDRAKKPSSNTPSFKGYIYDNDLVRLKHCYTKVALSTHSLESIGSNKSFIQEVRGIPWTREPSADTTWRVELAPDSAIPGLWARTAKQPKVEGVEVKEKWHSIKAFRLWNEQRQCYLMSHKVYRAPYSSYQEVGCITDGRQKGDTLFVVDRNVNPHRKPSLLFISHV
jgi:dolichyl-phosphate-mannose-protein mannosyltransferase